MKREQKRSNVVVTESTYCNLYESLVSAFDTLGVPDFEKCGLISIKINLCDARTPDTGAITHPLFLDALLKYVRDKSGPSATVNVVESDATAAIPDLFIKWFGFMPILERWKARYVNLSRDEVVTKDVKGRFFRKIAIPKTIAQSDCFISLAKLKTCSLTKISCVLKNQFGCLPKRRKIAFHKVIDDVIVDANLAMRPTLSIVDGIIAHVSTKGPAFGRPIPSDIVIVGDDPVAVDSCCARIFGFHSHFIGHIRKASKANLGEMENVNIILKGFSREPRIDPQFSALECYLGKMVVMLRQQ